MFAIPYFEQVALDLASTRIDTRDTRLPLFDYFTPKGYRARTIEIRAEVRVAEQAGIRGWNQPAQIVSPGQVRIIRAKPLPIRVKHIWDQSELGAFASYEQLATQAADSDTFRTADEDLARQILGMELKLRAVTRETVHHAYVGALLGSYVYEVDGADSTVSYNLPDLTALAGSPDWDSAASDIVGSMDLAITKFRDGAAQGVNATHVACDASAVWGYIRKNTALKDPDNGYDWQAIRAFFSALGDLQGGTSEPDPIWGKRWVPVDGSRLVKGVSTQRWPAGVLSLFNPTANQDSGEPVLEHAQAFDLLNPTLGARLMTGGPGIQADPAEFYLRDAWNVVAVVRDPRFVQTFTIAPNL